MAAVAATHPARPARLRSRRWNARLLLGGTGLLLFSVAALLGPLIAPFSPTEQHLDSRLQASTAAFLLGTDNLGRDVLSRLLYGLRPSLASGLAAVALAAVAGTLLGVPSGYYGKWVDAVVGRMLDLLISWPLVFLAIALALLYGPGESKVVIAIGLAELPVFARVMRAVTLANVRAEHVEAARSVGASGVRIMRLHIFPFALAPLVVQFAIGAPQAVVAEASLSYVGLGTQPPNPSLGSMLSSAQSFISYSAGGVVFPVLTIVLLVLSLTIAADGLQDLLDPRRRRR